MHSSAFAILAGLLLAVNRPILEHKRSAWFVLGGIFIYTILVGADVAVAFKAGHHHPLIQPLTSNPHNGITTKLTCP